MNSRVFCIYISFMLLLQYTLSKTLPEALEIDSESEVSDSFDDIESIHGTNSQRFKNSQGDRHIRRRRATSEKSNINKQCAIMYKNDEPVGILQPYKDSYQFLPIHSDELIPVDISAYSDSPNLLKRDTSLNAEDDEDDLGDSTIKKVDDSSQFSDERYPYIFAKFKVDSRLQKSYGNGFNRQKILHKRESDQPLADEKDYDSLSSTLSRIKTNDDGADVELRSILGDMGLIDDETHVDKREAEIKEDEDLEYGTNKINLIKLENSEERAKREDLDKKHDKQSETAIDHNEMTENTQPKALNEEADIDEYINENEEQQSEQKVKAADKEKRSNDVAAEMMRNIRLKLQKIKEEVRNEIDEIKSANKGEFKDDEEQNQEKEKSQRRKRQVISSLTDEETSDINPVISAENSLVPHIRRRRDILDKENIIADGNNGDLIQGSKPSGKQLPALNSYSSLKRETAAAIDKTETNFRIDLNPETKSSGESSNIIVKKSTTNGLSRLEKYKKKENTFKSNYESGQKTETDQKDRSIPEHPKEQMVNNLELPIKTKMILDGLAELKTVQHEGSFKNKRFLNKTPTEQFFYESTRNINEYVATTEKHFLVRNLKEYYNEELGSDGGDTGFETKESEKSNEREDINLNREKKSCKCSNGGKDCKCGKSPLRLLKRKDGTNFVYIDDVPRLADGPPSFQTASEINEEYNDKRNDEVKLKLLPLGEKRSAKENIKYRKSVSKFVRNLLDGKYTLDIDPDVYRITEENSNSVVSRRKRNSFSDLVEIHGGGPVINHLVAIKERSMLPRERVKRSSTKDQSGQQLRLSDMSDEDIFGALPQSFEGELARYKRV